VGVGVNHLDLLSICEYVQYSGGSHKITKKPQVKNSNYFYDRLERLVKPTLVLAINHNITLKTIAAEIGLITLVHHRGSFSENNRFRRYFWKRPRKAV
jgi:hypothetical protein